MKNQDNNKNRKKDIVYNTIIDKDKVQKFGRKNPIPKVPKSLKISNQNK